MKYFFILGTNPELSIAELTAVFDLEKVITTNFISPNKHVFIVELDKNIDCNQLINRLGGIIKIGQIFAESKKHSADIFAKIKENSAIQEKKFMFGFSSYLNNFYLKPLAMELKKALKEEGIASRWVTSREPVLSSVVVEQNDLITEGAEFVLIEYAGKVQIGRTLAVQPFKDLSFRDFGRPARDDHSGMLPPKLAQIMINLAKLKPEQTLLDPFCGSGTVITEAALMGLCELIGSDISPKAIEDTENNIQWIIKSYKLQLTSYKLHNKSATELSSFIKPNSVDAIVTEPYLGPQRGQHDTRKVVKELEELYTKSISEFKKILADGGRAVMIWPVFRTKEGNIFLSKNIAGNFKIIPPLPENLHNKNLRLSNRQTVIYGRPEQRVWREIVILKK